MANTHQCPGKECFRQVPQSQFACRDHWFSLPKHMRDAIWRGYRSGDGHFEAMGEAIEYLNNE